MANMRSPVLVQVYLFTLLLIASSTSAQNHENIDLVTSFGHHWGWVYNLEVYEDHAYVATGGTGLQVVDIAAPEMLQEAGHYNSGERIHDITIANDHAFIANGSSLIQALDVSDPRNPNIIGSIELIGSIYDIISKDTLLYISGNYSDDVENGYLIVIDVSEPAELDSIGGVMWEGYSGKGCVVEDYVYLGQTMKIIDVSDPTDPSLTRSLEISAREVAGSDGFLYTKQGADGEIMVIYNLEDPTQPDSMSSISVPGYIDGIHIKDDYAYITGSAGMNVIDISDRTNPVRIATHSIDEEVEVPVAVINGNTAVLGAYWRHDLMRDGGGEVLTLGFLQTIDVSEPEDPLLSGEFIPIYQFHDVSISDDYMIISGARGEFDLLPGGVIRVYDIEDLQSPTMLSQYVDEDMEYNNFCVFGNYIYIVRGSTRIRVIDMSDPTSLRPVAECQISSEARDISTDGELIYAARSSGFSIINIAELDNPQVINNFDIEDGITRGIHAIRPIMALVGDSLWIFNIENIEEPLLVGSHGLPDRAFKVKIHNDHVFVADGNDGLLIFNITEPEAPVLVSTFNTPGESRDIEIHGDFAYLTDMDGGIRIIHISDVENPYEMGYYVYDAEMPHSLAISENKIFSISENISSVHVYNPPEFEASVDELNVALEPDSLREIQLTISNGGSGELNWSGNVRMRSEAGSDPWTLRETMPVSELLSDPMINGVVFADSNYIIAGAQRSDEPNNIYVLDQNGELIDMFEQPGESNYGMKDIAWDGETIWGSGERTIFGIDLSGEIVNSFEGPYRVNEAIAWDIDRELLWISNVTNDIMGFNRDGQHSEDDEIEVDLNIYGLHYWAGDPDGFPLYVLSSPDLSRQTLHKINPDDGAVRYVARFNLEEGDSPGGICITDKYDGLSWVLMTITKNGGDDRLDIYQVQGKTDWLRIDPTDGMIDPADEGNVLVSINTMDLEYNDYPAELVFNHNALWRETCIPVDLNVNKIGADETNLSPDDISILNIHPNPFNNACRISYTIPLTQIITMQLHDLQGRKVKTLIDERVKAGKHTINVDGKHLSSGVYLIHLRGEDQTRTRKMVLVR